MSRKIKPAIDRVMEKTVWVPWSGCWIFMGAVNEAGYGIVGKGGRGAGNDRAHRVTFQHFNGAIPAGMFVCHHCDTPSCCNPDHLFLGTNQDNMRDCWSKGRGSKPPRNPHVVGSAHPGAKLNESQVVEIRRLRREGWTLQSLAEKFGVGDVTILNVARRTRWRHVA